MSKEKLLAKLKIYEEAETITVFASEEEAREYYNIYDYQNFKTIEEMKAYIGEYGFTLDDKWYHINYEFALSDIRELLRAYQDHEMSYPFFIEHQEDYVGKKVEITSKFKADGKEVKSQRVVWTKNEFGMPKEDSLIEVLNVKILD